VTLLRTPGGGYWLAIEFKKRLLELLRVIALVGSDLTEQLCGLLIAGFLRFAAMQIPR
jgi:hypothetical protein